MDSQVELKVDLTQRQAEAWKAFFDPSIRAILYGGAKGGGKSFWLCVLFYTLSLKIIEEHGLEATTRPIHWAWFGRKVGSDFVGTTLDTWQRVIPSDCYRICGATDTHPRHILIWDRVAIDFGGLDSQQAINKFNSAEYAVIGVDQAEETNKDDIAVLMGSLRLKINGKPWLTHNGRAMCFKSVWTANPAQCWLKEDFLDNPKDAYKFIRALPSDNRHLPEDYESVTLVEAFGHRPELLKAYRDGDWGVMSGAHQIIHGAWITSCKEVVRNYPLDKLYVACDTARFGDDETVIYGFNHYLLIDQEIYPKTTVTQIATKIQAMCSRIGAHAAVVESTGGDLGAGVIDILKSTTELQIVVFTPQGESFKTKTDATSGKEVKIYGNQRAEAWAYTAEKFSENVIPFPSMVGSEPVDTQLISQLQWPTYKFRNDRTYVESKDDIKKRMLRSNDKSDAYVMGIWGSQQIKEGSRRNERRVTKGLIAKWAEKYQRVG